MFEVEIWSTDRASKYGDGPIISAFDFRADERLNEPAQWSFRLPDEDTKASNIEEGREAYGYVWVGDNRLCVFGGEILQVNDRENGRGGLDLEVKGAGKLNDLNYQYIDELKLRDLATARPLSVVEMRTGLTNVNKPDLYDGDNGTSDVVGLDATVSSENWLAVFYPETIFNMSVLNGSPNATASTLTMQYFNGAWATASGLSDGTASGGATFGIADNTSGVISWTDPSDREDVISDGRQGCWYRFYVTSGSVTIDVREITLSTWGILTTDVNDFMTSAGGGMLIDGDYFSSTENGVYLILRRVTALQGLRQIAETENGMFRIKAHDDAKLSYLRSTPVTTNYYAVGPAHPADGANVPNSQLVITGLQRFKDTRKQVNRLYVYGAGNGDNRVTLERATDSLPAGYSYSAADSYIQYDAGYTANAKTSSKVFANIKGEGVETSHAVANTLLTAGLAELQNRHDAVEELRIELTHLPAVLRVGDSINVHYFREREGDTPALQIDGAYTVTQVRHQMENGVLIALATCSNVNKAPVTDDEAYLDMLEQNTRALATVQPVASTAVLGARVYEN